MSIHSKPILKLKGRTLNVVADIVRFQLKLLLKTQPKFRMEHSWDSIHERVTSACEALLTEHVSNVFTANCRLNYPYCLVIIAPLPPHPQSPYTHDPVRPPTKNRVISCITLTWRGGGTSACRHPVESGVLDGGGGSGAHTNPPN